MLATGGGTPEQWRRMVHNAVIPPEEDSMQRETESERDRRERERGLHFN